MTNPILINDRPMRIMFGCNSPSVPGGYGGTAALVVPRMRDRLGIDIAISATYGHYGRKLVWQGIDIYPPGAQMFGNDIHAANARQHRADILLTHQDVWTQSGSQITAGGVRWVSWAPLDAEPIAPVILGTLREFCYQSIALSRFGVEQAELAGLPMPLVLQGLDTNVFVPSDRGEARAQLGWPQDAFIVGMVARNSGYPNRKAYPQQLEAFAQFAKAHTDAYLYLHAFTDPAADPEATPILWQLEREGLLGRVILPSNFDLNVGYSTEQLVLRYQAMDVLLGVSMSEGCGIPLLEAQSCGVPVITGDWTAMRENCYAGWKVAYQDSEPWPVSPLECFWRLPRIGAITEKLEEAYGELQDEQIRDWLAVQGRHDVVHFHNQDMLIDTQWKKVLTDIATHIEAEPIPWHVHRWAGWGHETEQGVVAGCGIRDCPAEMRGGETAPIGFPLVVDGITLDISDDPNGGVRRAIAGEITQVYRLQEMTFEPGDVILDIGAHVGVVSCYLAKKWPETFIYAFEPVPTNYARLERNLRANGAANVTPFNVAVTADGRALTLHGDPSTNTGGYSAFTGGSAEWFKPQSATLPNFLARNEIVCIALLKLDCEGAEYEILRDIDLSCVAALVMEVHENNVLRAAHGSGASLIAAMERQIPHVRASLIRIPDAPEALELQHKEFHHERTQRA